MKTIYTIVKRLLSSNKISYFITFIVVLCATSTKEATLSNGNYTWLLALISPFFFVFYDYKKLMYLGVSKKDYFLGSLVSYGILAILISFMNTMFYVLIDPTHHANNLMEICGWTKNGVVIAAIQQMFFLFLCMIILHVLLSMQTHWYGYVVDAIVIIILGVFIPIAPLRHGLSSFFKIIMLNANALLHLGVCLLLGVSFSLIGLEILKKSSFI